MYSPFFLALAICVYILLAQRVRLRQFKAQQVVAQYIVAPVPESKAVYRFPWVGAIFSLVAAAALVFYLFGPRQFVIYEDYGNEPLPPGMAGSEQVEPPPEGFEDPPDELAEFGY